MNFHCHCVDADHRVGKLAFDGMYVGTAPALGNVLRRALLSEVEGTAVTAVRIHGAQHEFDTLDGVREDIPEIVANLRRLELRLCAEQSALLKIDTQQRHVTALDIQADDGVEILNSQQPIATLNPGARLVMEIEARKGRQGSGPDAQTPGTLISRSAVGAIPIPADFSPIKQVGYHVKSSDNGRERLVMQITTNGTVSPKDAMLQALGRLVGYLEPRQTVGEFNGSDGTFCLDTNILDLLGHALKWELLSHQVEGTQPVLAVRVSNAGISIRTDGNLAPRDALELCMARLCGKLTSMLEALHDAPSEQRDPVCRTEGRSGEPIVFGNLSFAEEMPGLLAVQRHSYQQFLDSGLPEVLNEMFPVYSDDDKAQLELLGYQLTTPIAPEECLRLGRTYASSLLLSLRINAQERNEAQEFQLDVGQIPLMTEDASFIIKGVRRVVVNQLHRAPGALFTRSEKDSKLVASIVPYRGSWIEFEISGNTDGPAGISVRLDRRKVLPATCLLRALGLETDEQITSRFADIDANEQTLIRRTLQLDPTSNRDEALLEIWRRLPPAGTPHIVDATHRFERMLADPTGYDLSRVGRRQLNRKLGLDIPEEERLVKLEDVIAVMHRLLAVHSGQKQPDDTTSLDERRVRSAGEQVANVLRIGFARLARHARQELCLLSQSDAKLTPTDLVEPKFVADALCDFHESSELSQVVQQINPLDEVTHKRRLSSLGPGGLPRDQTPFGIRAVHETHRGRICPVETPEGPSVGLITTLANHAQVNEHGFIEPGNTEHASRILGLSASLIPLIEYDDTSRALMGANMQRQAIPLLSTEAPLVQSGMEQKTARHSGAMLHARTSGQVTRATADEITIKNHDGTVESHRLTKYRRSNQATSISQKPIVSLGQTVHAGEPIADASSMRDGVLALGRNVLVAYMPWGGYNYEDGIVISDRLIRQEAFTSVHIEEVRVEAHHTNAGPERLTAHVPGRGEDDIAHLDERGLARAGTWVKPGDVLVGKVSPRTAAEPRLTDLLEEESIQYADVSSTVPAYIKGQVIRTRYLSKKHGDDLPAGVEEAAVVEVAMRREVQVGDKFANRHGNKGVVSKIVPEADMPHLTDGTPVDVLLNPLGVSRRGNYGQILETQLGWAAEQLGQTIVSPPYEGPSDEQRRELLVRAGLPENGMATLYDGRTGRTYDEEVLVGYQYLMKLNHLVEDKVHARAIGPYSIVTQQPLGGKAHYGGQRLGEMELWALEAYGAAHTVHEMLTLKANAATGLELYRRIANGTEPTPQLPVPLLSQPLGQPLRLFTSYLRGLGIGSTQDEEGMHVRLVSPDEIRGWAKSTACHCADSPGCDCGEVKKPETINYRTFRPERDGLFCEATFGPTKDWECACGKFSGIRHKGTVCDRCGVEITQAEARRERMGYVQLAAPIAHVWFLKEMPSPIGLLLGIRYRDLERVLYFDAHIVLEPGESTRKPQTLLSEEEYNQERGHPDFRAGIGGEAIHELLQRLDLDDTAEELTSVIQETQDAGERRRLRKRLRLIRELQTAGIRPEWLMLTVLPVVPPGIRPIVQVSEDPDVTAMSAASDLNTLYRQVIHRNNRLKRLTELGAPKRVIHNETRSLQEAVDALMDNGRHGDVERDEAGRPLGSFSDMVRGKPGLPRNLLGARVDYSGRSVIAPGPELRLGECGLPRMMALRLFEPFVIHELMQSGHARGIQAAKRLVDEARPEATIALAKVVDGRLVLLNHAPTLHRAGLQAFRPVLTDEKAIRLHPLVCRAFNADFDGDQMALHVPITEQAQGEASKLLLSSRNLLSLADGSLLVRPMHEISLGCHYLTLPAGSDAPGISVAMTPHEVQRAYELEQVELHSQVIVRWEGQEFATTAGRVIFNLILNGTHPYVHEVVDSARLTEILETIYQAQGETEIGALLDRLMALAFWSAECGVRRTEEESLEPDIPVPQPPEAYFAAGQVGREQLYGIVSRTESVGYLSRKLATVAASVVVTEPDCGTEQARNPVTCETLQGVCATCYGTDLTTGQTVALGTPVGMLALSALGEHTFRLPLESVRQVSRLLESQVALSVDDHMYTLTELLVERGADALHRHLLEPLQAVYREQGIEIAAKHFEVLIRQMLSQVCVLEPGDTPFLEEEIVSRSRLMEQNAIATAGGRRPATYEPQVVGITEAALATDSFLAGAAFQQTTSVLTKAALAGATDPLRGIHECVIAGKLIPVGTGFPSA